MPKIEDALMLNDVQSAIKQWFVSVVCTGLSGGATIFFGLASDYLVTAVLGGATILFFFISVGLTIWSAILMVEFMQQAREVDINTETKQ
jgi:hypothetical protein